MGLSKAMSELRQTRLQLNNDIKWCIEMVKELEKDEIELYDTKEALLIELKSLLESVLESIHN